MIIASVIPEEFSFDGFNISRKEIEKIKKTYDENNIEIKIVLNKFDKRTKLETKV